jgi:hypothetical protein
MKVICLRDHKVFRRGNLFEFSRYCTDKIQNVQQKISAKNRDDNVSPIQAKVCPKLQNIANSVSKSRERKNKNFAKIGLFHQLKIASSAYSRVWQRRIQSWKRKRGVQWNNWCDYYVKQLWGKQDWNLLIRRAEYQCKSGLQEKLFTRSQSKRKDLFTYFTATSTHICKAQGHDAKILYGKMVQLSSK